ncbi:hypothetical protein FHX37_2806 [Haloactinospora alba]|uniref:Uncharacterized protein n=1 Tax=Haloactinospora alba TaxID=405555 RepID=A0A543NLY3_9ACTN|nr:hypothetical protein [Haloactinospora alba]TQN32822.1 hypothetical protein FHX37_2806 [Haloactinospora alba]
MPVREVARLAVVRGAYGTDLRLKKLMAHPVVARWMKRVGLGYDARLAVWAYEKDAVWGVGWWHTRPVPPRTRCDICGVRPAGTTIGGYAYDPLEEDDLPGEDSSREALAWRYVRKCGQCDTMGFSEAETDAELDRMIRRERRYSLTGFWKTPRQRADEEDED